MNTSMKVLREERDNFRDERNALLRIAQEQKRELAQMAAAMLRMRACPCVVKSEEAS